MACAHGQRRVAQRPGAAASAAAHRSKRERPPPAREMCARRPPPAAHRRSPPRCPRPTPQEHWTAYESKLKAKGLSGAAVASFKASYEQLAAGVTGMVRGRRKGRRAW